MAIKRKAAFVEGVFLDLIEEHKVSVWIYLANGIRLGGVVVDHDLLTVYLKRDGIVQMVSKDSISTVAPQAQEEQPEELP